MLKILILVVTVHCAVSSLEKDWFKGKWLQAVIFPSSTILIPQCDWNEFSPPLTSECKCSNKTVPLVTMIILKHNYGKAFPAIIFEDINGLQETLEQKCQCPDGHEEYPIVFRYINEDYMVLYGRYTKNMYSKGSEPNVAVLLVKKVPKLSEMRRVIRGIEDLSKRDHAFNCEANYFVNEFDNLD